MDKNTNEYKRGFADGVESEKRKIQLVIERILHVADSCEAGGHTSRGKMFRAIAREFQTWDKS